MYSNKNKDVTIIDSESKKESSYSLIKGVENIVKNEWIWKPFLKMNVNSWVFYNYTCK